MEDLNWFRSSYTNNSGNCVEVAGAGVGRAVRDSKDPSGPMLVFGAESWTAFVEGVKRGRFDLPND